MLIGLSMATKVAPRSMTPGLRVAHERIAIVALVALGAHGLLLLGDSFLRRGRSPGYVTAALSLSYYARKRIGARRWRNAHRWIPIAWLLGAAHVIGSGTDIGDLWMQVPFALTIGAVLALLGLRVSGPTRTAPRPSHPVVR
jgi:methionine sulfoxide reductase heme-binding subunit